MDALNLIQVINTPTSFLYKMRGLGSISQNVTKNSSTQPHHPDSNYIYSSPQ